MSPRLERERGREREEEKRHKHSFMLGFFSPTPASALYLPQALNENCRGFLCVGDGVYVSE